jgi:O-antigen/teichoic acid export membrane protein
VTLEIVSDEVPLDLPFLEKKAIRASYWSVLEYGSATALRVISSLVLTRLLVPATFGEMTLVTTLMIGINLLSDVGLAPSVIQSPRGDEPVFLNTAWTIQVIRGVGLWCVALAISWPMSLFYHNSTLKFLLPVLALSTLLSGFNSTNLLTLSRHMGVRRLFAIDGSTSVVSLVVTIAWAYFSPSVWAIVAGQLAGSTYRLVLSHMPRVTPGIRNSFHLEKASVTSMIHFGKWIMIATAFFFFASQSDRLILGKLITLSLLGIYGLAYSLSDIPRQVILALGARVAYPFIAKIINLPKEEFQAKFLHYRFLFLLVGAFLLSVMANWGPLVILKLYDKRYHEAAWMIPILTLGLWDSLLYQTTVPVLLSLGKPKYTAFGNALYCLSIVVGIPVAFHFYGMLGAVIAIAAGDWPLYLVVQFAVRREGVKPFAQDLKMTGIFLAILAACYGLRHAF